MVSDRWAPNQRILYEFCASVNGHMLNEDQIRKLAQYESFKDQDAKVDGLMFGYMASDCLKIAEHHSVSSLEANEGRELAQRFKEWKSSEVDTSVEQARVLCKRMAHFLTRNFARLLPEPQTVSGRL